MPALPVSAPGRLPPEVLARIATLCECAWPAEACGAVLREASGALSVHPLRNVRVGPAARTGYEADPGELLALYRQADARGASVAVLFHSHVEGGPELSASDRAQAITGGEPLHPGAALLVVSVQSGKAAAAALHTWAEGRFRTRDIPLL